ncbi:Peptide chain release factor 1, mitochondrial [Collichthys lucidus]|uniref:Peptide chain release factor 1, mitochondrial n=1 Tax=Collichthys lucidus TaxID=240159 RepID=A0A4U5TXE1_COLLU|nr:Peptide chain release factor 1, mitochondrial [Collichthys lucidus]
MTDGRREERVSRWKPEDTLPTWTVIYLQAIRTQAFGQRDCVLVLLNEAGPPSSPSDVMTRSLNFGFGSGGRSAGLAAVLASTWGNCKSTLALKGEQTVSHGSGLHQDHVMPDVCGDRRTGLQPAGTREEDEQVMQLLREEEARISSQISALRKDYVFFISIHMCSGDVCQQFTREMYDMYQGFASYENWDFEVLNYTNAEYGGLHHAAVRIAGENVYRHLKHEGGTHRVRRIPEVGLSSRMQRIHTGTMTVIILPQPVELLNGDTVMRVLKARLYRSMMDKETEQRHTARKQQMGMRSQSDGIRTYNFSQDRITDHRTGYVARDIKEFMRGGEALDDLICDVRHDVAVYPYAISSKLHLREQHPDRADLQACMPVFKSFAFADLDQDPLGQGGVMIEAMKGEGRSGAPEDPGTELCPLCHRELRVPRRRRRLLTSSSSSFSITFVIASSHHRIGVISGASATLEPQLNASNNCGGRGHATDLDRCHLQAIRTQAFGQRDCVLVLLNEAGPPSSPSDVMTRSLNFGFGSGGRSAGLAAVLASTWGNCDVCQQFTREMYDMYQGFASYENWDFEVLNYTNAEYDRRQHKLKVFVLTHSDLEPLNGDTVMRVLKARLYRSMMDKETEQRHTARKQQMGMRSQSDGIRTYNFSQDRITDHRTGYVARDIKEFMRGGEALDDLICDVRHDVAVYPYAISSKLHLRVCVGAVSCSEHPDREERTRRKHAERRRPVPAGTPGDGGGGSALLLTVQE